MGSRFNAYILVIVSLMISASMISCTPTKISLIESPAASEAKEEVSVEATPTVVEKRPAEETRQPEAVLGHRLKRETAKLITYGLDTPVKEGDDDHVQIIYFRVPVAVESRVHLRLFDADCGGLHDSVYETLNTQTRFSLFGGINIITGVNVNKIHPSEEALTAGNLIKRLTFGQNAMLDNAWSLFATVLPSDGERVGDMYIFKLVVEGLAGNDGNVFDVSMSLVETRNVPVPGLTATIHAPTIRLDKPNAAAEMRFYVPPENKQVTVFNFDAALAKVTLETAFRTITVGSSGQGVLSETTSLLDPMETDRLAALVFHSDGEESPNDATFYVKDHAGSVLPIYLPIFVDRPNHRPRMSFNIESLADCLSVGFDAAATTDPDNDLLSFDWDFGDGNSGQGTKIVHHYEQPGTYAGSLIISDSSAWIGNKVMKRYDIEVNAPPKADAGPVQIVAPGQKVTFDGSASTDTDGKLQSFLWDFGDGTQAKAVRAIHTYPQPGQYIATLRVEDDSETPCNWGVDETNIWVNSAPVAAAGQDIRVAAGTPIVLDAGRSYDPDGKIIRFLWDLGDGSRLEGVKIQPEYTVPAKYSVTLTVIDDSGAINGTDNDKMTVIINQPPQAEAGPDRQVAVGEPVMFDASASVDPDGHIVDYEWNFGDGRMGRGKRIPYAYDRSGTYAVILTIKDDLPGQSALAQDTLTVTVNAPPVADAAEDQLVTTSEVQFDATKSQDPDGSIQRYVWDFGDGLQGEGATPVHVYNEPGIYRAKVTVIDDSQTTWDQAQDRVTIIVNQRPTADAGPDPAPVAPGDIVQFLGLESFDSDGEIVSYKWDFGDGKMAGGPSVAHAFEHPGTYTVALTVFDDTGDPNAVDYDEVLVKVNAQPVADAGHNIKASPGEIIDFDGSTSYDPDGRLTNFQWVFSDGAGEASKPLTRRSFDKPGFYTARLTVTDDSGASNASNRAEVAIHINHPPRAIAGKNIHTCDAPILFDASQSVDPDGDPLTYKWDFGDGTTASGEVVSHVYSEGGLYPVTLMVDDGTDLTNARHSTSMVVSINRPPTADAGDHLTICAGEVAIFDGSASKDPDGGVLKYHWDFGDGDSSDKINPTKIYTKGGLYSITLTVEDESGLTCNTDIDQFTARVAESPLAVAGTDQTVCANMPVQFDGSASRDADGVVNRYLWDFGDSTTGGGPTPEHIFSEPGNYLVRLTVTGDQVADCDNIDTDELTVRVRPAPQAQIAGPEAVPVGEAAFFDGSQSHAEGVAITSWLWDFGDGTSEEGEQVSHTYTESGKFVVTLTIMTDSAGACQVVTAQKFIFVNGAPIADAGLDQIVGVNDPITFSGAASKDADGAISSYKWDFGDGLTATGVQVLHRYRQSGRYPVVLRVQDDTQLTNNTATDTIYVTVNAAPLPHIDGPAFACIDEAIHFNAARSTDTDGEILEYHWRFGDGSTAKGVEVTHAWKTLGRFPVTLAVKDETEANNSWQQQSQTVTVNRTPIADAGPNRLVCVGEVIEFDGSASLDPDGTLVQYHWRFGDGAQTDGSLVRHTYDQPGNYTVNLSIEDNSKTTCGSAASAAQVRVNTRPIAKVDAKRVGYTGGAHDDLVFDGSESHDPDGDKLSYYWDFGDGNVKRGSKVHHYFQNPGDYTVRLTVQDNTGLACGVATDEVMVKISAR